MVDDLREDENASARQFGRALALEIERAGRAPSEIAAQMGKSASWLSNWIKGLSTPRTPAEAFAVEDEIGVSPGSLTQLLGYVPVGAEKMTCTVAVAIAGDPDLTDTEKDVLMNTYQVLVSGRTRP